MERPSVQAPDTFYPEAVSHNTIAVRKPQGVIFTASLTFPAVKGLHPARLSGLPLFPQRSGKNTEKTPHSLFIRDAVHLPGSAPPRFQLSRLCRPSSSWEKKPEFTQEEAYFRTVRDKFQGFRPVVLDLRQKYARFSLSH